MQNKIFKLILLLSVISLLEACAAVAVTGIVTGASVAIDKRDPDIVVLDEGIELKAFKAILDDKELDNQTHLNVTSYNTIVLVTGEAPTEELRQRVIDHIRKIPKIEHIHNEIAIAAPSSYLSRSSDSVITSKVKTKLLADETVEGLYVKVVTELGVVYLMGIVSRNQADISTEIARKTGGVQKVVKLFQYID